MNNKQKSIFAVSVLLFAAIVYGTVNTTEVRAPQALATAPLGSLPAMSFSWGDEFDGSSVDLTKWKISNDTRPDDSNKTFYRPENVSVSDGTLKLAIKNEPITANNYLGQSKTANYTGGMLEAISANSTDSKGFRLEQYR